MNQVKRANRLGPDHNRVQIKNRLGSAGQVWLNKLSRVVVQVVLEHKRVS